MFAEYDDLMTTEEACTALKIGYNYLYQLLNTGKLKAYRCGRIWRIPKIAIENYILESSNLMKS